MRLTICLTAAIALCACSQAGEAPPADNAAEANVTDANAVDANAADANGAITMADYRESSWEYVEDGKPRFESIDANGNYITVSGTEHVDHGTAVMKGSKICFTSAMNDEGEECWQDPKLAVGESGESVSDKGEKVTVKRVAYRPLSMPS